MFGLATLPVAAGAIATGCVFGSMNLGLSRNPEMKAELFTNSLISFALIETFVFIGIGMILSIYIIL